MRDLDLVPVYHLLLVDLWNKRDDRHFPGIYCVNIFVNFSYQFVNPILSIIFKLKSAAQQKLKCFLNVD